MANEPVLKAASVPAIVIAAWAFAESMNWIHFTAAQDAKLFALVGLIVPVLAGLYARSKVRPV